MCEPTFEEWFEHFAGELARLDGESLDFDQAYNCYLPAFEGGICGGSCARRVAGAEVDSEEWEDAELCASPPSPAISTSRKAREVHRQGERRHTLTFEIQRLQQCQFCHAGQTAPSEGPAPALGNRRSR